MQKILVITGSSRPTRKSGRVAEWFIEAAGENKNFTFELADLAEIDLPFLDEPTPALFAKYRNDHTKAWAAKLAAADGFVFVTPEYNHGYPAVLKNAIDYAYAEWNHKPVGFVSYGVSGGIRSTEQLKPVIVHLNSVPINAQVSLLLDKHWNEDGSIAPDEQTTANLSAMLESLQWWGEALKAARNRQ